MKRKLSAPVAYHKQEKKPAKQKLANYIKGNLIVYHGPSAYDGSPIVAILQRGSSNSKTGAMAQLWILSADMNPIVASRTGKDYSVCGNCPHRGAAAPNNESGWAENRGCYVNLLHGPLGKYKSFKAGKYKRAETIGEVQELLHGQGLRLGAYGDPAALPSGLCEMLADMAEYATSYTHGHTAWNDVSKIATVASYSMVSADNAQDALKAHAKGFRTFRVIPVAQWKDVRKDSLLASEILCPASEEAGKKVQCADCRLCNGTKSKAKSIAIVAHGKTKKHVKG